MQMSDTRQINASPAEVYAALLDPDMLIKCVPGATEVTGSPEDGFEATVVQKVGPVKATFKGQVTMTDMIPDQSIKISGEGKGGAAGFAKGEADVKCRMMLKQRSGASWLSWAAASSTASRKRWRTSFSATCSKPWKDQRTAKPTLAKSPPKKRGGSGDQKPEMLHLC